MNAIEWNPYAKQQFEKLKKKNKHGMLSVIAVANKLVKQMFAVVKSGVKFDPNYLENKRCYYQTLQFRTILYEYLGYQSLVVG